MRADAASPSRTPAAGDVLDGRYRIVKPIARGRLGTVFLAEHTLIKRPLAIKLLHADLARDRSTVERFMTEALAAGMLGHPNIVQATDMGFSGDRPYLVFEYLEGCLLSEEIYRVGGVPLRRTLDIAMQLASALDAAHGAEIVHLDLNTANVMLTYSGDTFDHVKVLDFGIARFLDGTPARVVTATPEFMAPEQVYAPGWIDPRTDVYALGVCIYEMLAARRPFRSDSQSAVFDRILHAQPLPIDREIPVELRSAIFDRMLAKEPTHRFATIHDAYNALHAISLALPSPPAPRESRRLRAVTALEPPSPRTTAVRSTPRPTSKPRRRAPVNLALLAAIVVAGVSYLYPRKPVPSPSARAAVREAGAAPSHSRERALVLEGAKQRALAIAASPMLRAAIETDAPTMLDLLTTDGTFALRPGEVLEVYQGASTLLARVPPGSAPLAPNPSDRLVQVTVPVLGRAQTQVGKLVLAVTVVDDSTVVDER